MKKLVLVAVLLFGFSVIAVAQDVPAAELFGGYSFMRADAQNNTVSLNGWSTSIALNANKIVGVVGDMGGYYGKLDNPGVEPTINVFSLMFGPRISVRKGKVTPFVQALFGYSHASSEVNNVSTGKENDFAMAYGGGVDINVSNRIAIRPAQIEYVGVKSGPDLLNNFRYSAGIVFKFGKR
jgi:opacity protein-like surface antigen